MRNLFILRGSPASGKSTWIKENNLEQYTLSTDNVRLMYSSPVTKEDGTRCITQKNDKAVWRLLFELLEKRMSLGEFIIVDATHYKSSMISQYKDLVKKYRYRVNVVDFSGVSEEECLRRNAQRDAYKKVPEDVIKKMYACLKDDAEVKKAYKILTPDEASKMLKSPLEPVEINPDKVVIFGDIHGCYTPLKEYFDKNPYNENNCYIFCGDYLDRGKQNKEVLEFLLDFYKKPNVYLLEGNHEIHVIKWASKDYTDSKYGYSDYYVVKIVEQLKVKKAETENKNVAIEKMVTDVLDTWKQAKKENPETTEIFYAFEKVDAIEKLKELREQISRNNGKIRMAEHYIDVLGHEKNNTYRTVEDCCSWFNKSFNESLNLNIKNLISKELNMSENKEDMIYSSEFRNNTIPQIKDLNKSDVRQLCRKFIQMSYFSYNGYKFLVTHGGLPCLPDIFTPTDEMIHGVGRYEDHALIDENFCKNTDIKTYQIHGHRNVLREPLKADLTMNLEGQVEFGGCLRIVEISKDGIGLNINPIEIRNTDYIEEEKSEKSDLDILKDMFYSKYIRVKNLEDNIVSFNFTEEAFEKDVWNKLTCHARGLFVDKTNGNIAARSFSKFFNFGEQDCTSIKGLKDNIAFPLKGYKKENGFLGIVSKYNGKVRIYTKSMDSGDFVNYFIGVLCKTYKIRLLNEDRTKVTEYSELYNAVQKIKQMAEVCTDAEKLKELNSLIKINTNILKLIVEEHLKPYLSNLLTEGYSYVFECVDIENDPHMIKYDWSQVRLLEVFKNQLKEEHVSYKELCDIAKKLEVPVKQRVYEFYSWDEFYAWIKDFMETNKWECRHEGYVFEDANGFRVKFKSAFYHFWKQMRALKDILENGRENKKIYKSKEEIQVVKLLEQNLDRLKEMSIIDIEDLYHEKYGEQTV